MGIYLYSDTINYLILAIIKKHHLLFIIESNVGTLMLFIGRCILTLIFGLAIAILQQQGKNAFRK